MKLVHLIAAALFLIFSTPSSGLLVADKLSGDTLKVLTWNIYMLPLRVYHKSEKRDRACDIVKVLRQTDYDIVVFQEAFHSGARGIISNGLKAKFPYQYGPLNHGGISFRFNGGVYILSKIPLKLLKQIAYKARTDYDKYARKGAVLLEGYLDGKTFQLAGTHIQAGPVPDIKFSQMKQLRNELLDPFRKEGVVQIVGGDFNTNSHEPEQYQQMISILGAEDGKLTGEKRFSKASGTEIDYILIKDNNAGSRVVKRNVVIFNPLNPALKELSDHYAIEAVIVL